MGGWSYSSTIPDFGTTGRDSWHLWSEERGCGMRWTRGEGMETDIPTVYSISSERIGHSRNFVGLKRTELKKCCFGSGSSCWSMLLPRFNGSDCLHSSQLSRLESCIAVGGEWSASRPGRFTSERGPGTHWIGGWVGPRAGLDAVEKRKILPCREQNPGRPSCSSSLYRLSYPDSLECNSSVHWRKKWFLRS
jgi:hypothetical protein